MSPYFGVIDDALKDNISPQSPKVMNFYIHISNLYLIARETIGIYSDISKFQI